MISPNAWASSPSGDQLSPDQRSTINNLNTPATVSSLGSSKPKGSSATPASSKRLSLYRGSFLMWARDTATWYYDYSRVNSSTLWQEAGYVFPNTSQAKGTSRYYTATTKHSWRGRYTIGAGTTTPWGSVNLYAADYSTDWQPYRNGAGTGQWN
ncbi:MAG: hypothetical protein ABIQ61_11360 [Ornithinibacter sp.]